MNIPVFLNSYNRLTWLKDMVEELWRFDGVESIYIVDNDSAYPPLLDYLSAIENGEARTLVPVRVVRLAHNDGPRGAYHEAKRILTLDIDGEGWKHFAVMDPDLDLSELPNDFFLRCAAALDMYPDINKVGPSLHINDLPEDSLIGERVKSFEEKYWTNKRDKYWFEADIDTHAFVMRVDDGFSYGPGLRSLCSARHLPWYLTIETLSDEDIYYLKSLPPEHASGIYWSTLLRDDHLLQPLKNH